MNRAPVTRVGPLGVRWVWLAAGAGLLLALACGGTQQMTSPVRRQCCQFETAYDLVPGDVDIVVRLAWSQVRTGPLYDTALRSLSGRAGDSALVPVLERARTVLLGLRIMPDGLQGDGVIVVEGDGGEQLTDAQAQAILGGSSVQWSSDGAADGSRLAMRTQRAQRWDRAAIWVLERKAVVVASTAEADALERLMHQGPDPNRLDVPARGLLSFAARVPPGDWIGTWREPARSLAVGLTGIRGTFDLVDSDVRLEAELSYQSDAAAIAAAAHINKTLERLSRLEGTAGSAVREVRRRARVTAEGRTLAAAVTMPLAWVVGAIWPAARDESR